MCDVNPDFAEWAKLPSGCDGGNLRGAIWVCGVEWGDTKCPDQRDFAPDQLDFRKEISELTKGFPERSPEIHKIVMKRGSGFDLKAFKLISVIARSKPLSSLSDVRNYAQKHITYTANKELTFP